MATVLKYQLHLTAQQRVALSAGAVLLTVTEQSGVLCLWAEVAGRILDTSGMNIVTVYMVPTGSPVPDDAVRYLCTVQMNTGTELLVVHVYEGPRA